MASVGTYKAKGKGDGPVLHRIMFTHPADRSRKTIWLGAVSIRTRNEIRERVEDLVKAILHGCTPDDDTSRWLKKQSRPILEKLVKNPVVRRVVVAVLIAAMMAMTPTTTINSIRLNPWTRRIRRG